MSYEKDGQILYEVGDWVRFHFQTFPGPTDRVVNAEVIKYLTETFYEIRFEFQGKTVVRQIIRSHLP